MKPQHTATRYLAGFGLYLAAWALFALFRVTETFSQMQHWHPEHWRTIVAIQVTVTSIWAVLTPLVLWLSVAFPINRLNWRNRLPLYLLFSFGLFLLQVSLYAAIINHVPTAETLGKRTVSQVFQQAFQTQMHMDLFTYWIIVGIYNAFVYYRKRLEREQAALELELQASELRSQLAQAQLNALRIQLQPHFLFNTLNAIMVLLRQQDYLAAEDMLGRLHDLLQSVFDDMESQEVPLRRELDHVRLYLAIQEVRFRDRLRVEITADPQILDARIASMCLQPLVENAIRHGVARKSGAGLIRVSANQAGDGVKVQVEDDGVGIDTSKLSYRSGIGLANTRARLRHLYGERSSLSMENTKQGGTLVTIMLPYQTEPLPESTGARRCS